MSKSKEEEGGDCASYGLVGRMKHETELQEGGGGAVFSTQLGGAWILFKETGRFYLNIHLSMYFFLI